jgi:hypothetical protein
MHPTAIAIALVQEDCLCKLILLFWGYYVFKCKVLLRDSTFLLKATKNFLGFELGDINMPNKNLSVINRL